MQGALMRLRFEPGAQMTTQTEIRLRLEPVTSKENATP
jgi:hypothetical protein